MTSDTRRRLLVAAVSAAVLIAVLFALPRGGPSKLETERFGTIWSQETEKLPDWIYDAPTADGRKFRVDFTRTGVAATDLEPFAIQTLRWQVKRTVAQLSLEQAETADGREIIDRAIGSALAEYRLVKTRLEEIRAHPAPAPPPSTIPSPNR